MKSVHPIIFCAWKKMFFSKWLHWVIQKIHFGQYRIQITITRSVLCMQFLQCISSFLLTLIHNKEILTAIFFPVCLCAAVHPCAHAHKHSDLLLENPIAGNFNGGVDISGTIKWLDTLRSCTHNHKNTPSHTFIVSACWANSISDVHRLVLH